MNRLFKGIVVALTAIGAAVVIWQDAQLLQYFVAYTKQAAIKSESSFGLAFVSGLTTVALTKDTKLLFIASAVEIALVWLLVQLNVISQRRGLIATLILFILVGITVFIVYREVPILPGM